MGNTFFLTFRMHPLIVCVVTSRVTAATSPYSVWGMRHQPRCGWCETMSFEKNHNLKVKIGKFMFSHLASVTPVCFYCQQQGRVGGGTRFSLGGEIKGVAYDGSKNVMVVVHLLSQKLGKILKKCLSFVLLFFIFTKAKEQNFTMLLG